MGNGAISGGQCCLCCWQSGHPAVAVARWALWVEARVAEPTHKLHPCHRGHFVHELVEGSWTGITEWITLFSWWLKSSAEIIFWWTSHETQISSQSAPTQRNPSISNTSFPYFLISNLPVPFHLEKPLATAHSGHFLHQIWQINILFKLCPLRRFSFTLDCPADPWEELGTPLCCQRWILEKSPMLQVPGREAKFFPPSVSLQPFFYWQSLTLW